MAKSQPDEGRVVSPKEAALMFGRFMVTHQKNALLGEMFPEGIGPLDREKVVARIRKHFPEVPRGDIYKMNPGQLLYYLREVYKADKAVRIREKPPTKAKQKRLTVNERMGAVLLKRPESREWSAQQWADCLGCRKSTVADTLQWKALLAARVGARLERQVKRAKK